eukprot:CAMPEP_0194269762 /NCGR_PEP_ID=MMETSP0169-20130528/3877_1 /TAXON_ID=218684 /ORGANISM="Corethron pennatum, Strain L29A3" /LENGTH=296 /DNA_ID=CAMNT_0039011545 /DNA_START=63 /DNA_END=953 /DNA_ORIENTATION=-
MVRNSNSNHGSHFSTQSRETTEERAVNKRHAIIRNVNKTTNDNINRTPVRATYGKSDIYQARSCSLGIGKKREKSTKTAAHFPSNALKSEALKTPASTGNSSFSSLRSAVSKDSSKGSVISKDASKGSKYRLSRASTSNSQSSSKRSKSVDGSSMRSRRNHVKTKSHQSQFLTDNFSAVQMESNSSIRAVIRNKSNYVSNVEVDKNLENGDAANDQNNEEEYEYTEYRSVEQRLVEIRDYTVKSAAKIGKATGATVNFTKIGTTTANFTNGAVLGLGKRVEDVIENGLSALMQLSK